MTPSMMTPSNDHLEQMEKATQGMMKACQDMGGLARDQLDATMKSASAMTKGFDEIARNAGTLIQESLNRTVTAGKTIMGAKSVQEVMNTQNEFIKDCFDCWVAGTGKISEISARMTQDVVGPMAEHTNNAMNKIAQKTRAAA